MRWSVAVEAEGDREMTREEVVELADAVAPVGGIASGIGTTRYGAQLIVEAASLDEAVHTAQAEFRRAATKAGLPPWPAIAVQAISEDEDIGDYNDGSEIRDVGAAE